MKYLKKSLALLMATILLLSMAACSATPAPTLKPESSSSEASGVIELTDQIGRKLTLKEPAKSIVSCYYITTYATIALGISDRVVGLEKKADTRPIYHMAAPELLTKKQVGSMKEFNVEATAALKPDLVLMPAKLADHADTLTSLGIQVLVVKPESQKQMEDMLTLIAKACGVEDRAKALLTYYDTQIAKMKELTKDAKKPTVYMGGNSSFMTTATGDMYQSDIIGLAGGKNVAADVKGDRWAKVSYEAILAYDPQVILIPCNADYTAEDILNDQNLAGVTAVKNKAVFQMPKKIEEWDSPVPSGVLGIMWITSVLHEDLYPFETFQKDAADYYKSFYGFDIDRKLITK